jgi:hypothetical protein
MTRQDAHHIQIKNLRTGQQEGFLLTSGDKPFAVQGVDTIATRISEGEVLYSDFTNSRVFPQSDWSGGISKYWDPERISSTIYPTTKYSDSYNAKLDVAGEFTIGASALIAKDFSNPVSGFLCATNGEAAGVVYGGVKGELKIWRSTDHGITWSVYQDLTTDTRLTGFTDILDIVFVKNKKGIPSWNGSSVMGQNNEQIWFVAYNPNTGESRVCKTRKGLYTQSVWMDGSTGHYWMGAANTSMNSQLFYGTPSNNVNFWTLDFSEFTSLVTWNNNSTNGWASLQYSAWLITAGFYPGQIIEVNYGGTWYTHTVQYVDNNYIQFNGYITGRTNGNCQVRIKPNNKTYAFLADTTDISIYGSAGAWAEDQHGHLGNMATINGKRYMITCIMDRTSAIGTYWGQMGRWSGWDTGFSATFPKGIVQVTCMDSSDASDLSGKGVQAMTAWQEVEIMPSANLLWVKKLLLIQNTTDEELLALPSDLSRAIVLGTTQFGNNPITYYTHNLYNHVPVTSSAFNTTTAVWVFPVLPTGHYPTSGCQWGTAFEGYIGTQLGTNESGVEAKLLKITCTPNWTTPPTISDIATLGEQSISCMTFAYDQLWIGTNLDGWVYTYDNNTILKIAKMPTIEGAANNYIDSIASYNGKIVLSYQKWLWVYVMDPNTYNPNASPVIAADILCTIAGKTPSQSFRITKLLSTGVNLLIGTNDSQELYYYNRTTAWSECYVTSSIYGWYISNVDKLWLYAYLRVEPWTADDWQKVRLQVSLDEGNTWYWLPTKKFTPLETSPISFTDYEHEYVAGGRNDQFRFFFPANTLSNTIQYRAWLYKGTTYKPVCNHVSLHFMINYRQELLFNYNISLAPNQETLDGRHIDKRVTQDKVAFLKEIWQNQDMCLFTHVDWKKYAGVPFSDDRTPGQWLVIQAQNANSARLDLENMAYNVLFTLKTIANYDEQL